MRLGQASPARATTRLRALLKEPAPLILPGCFNAMSARILEHAGFPALYMSGYGTSLNLLGLPDAGLITLTEMALIRALAMPSMWCARWKNISAPVLRGCIWKTKWRRSAAAMSRGGK
jgi:hypothetical protein